MASGPHSEPFNGRELRRFLEQAYKARFLRQKGSHIQLQLPDGKVLMCMDDSEPVTQALMRWNAGILGMTYAEHRSEVMPKVNRGKPRGATRPKQRVFGKKTAMAALDDVIEQALEIKREITSGDRDPSVYERIYGSAIAAKQRLMAYDTTS